MGDNSENRVVDLQVQMVEGHLGPVVSAVAEVAVATPAVVVVHLPVHSQLVVHCQVHKQTERLVGHSQGLVRLEVHSLGVGMLGSEVQILDFEVKEDNCGRRLQSM